MSHCSDEQPHWAGLGLTLELTAPLHTHTHTHVQYMHSRDVIMQFNIAICCDFWLADYADQLNEHKSAICRWVVFTFTIIDLEMFLIWISYCSAEFEEPAV